MRLQDDSSTWQSTNGYPPSAAKLLYVRPVAITGVPFRTQHRCVMGRTFYLTMRCYIVATAFVRGQRFQA